MQQAEMESKPSLVIFYGSQTGNAEDVAERIGREAERRHLDAAIISMDTYDPVQCKLKTIFLVTLIYATIIHMIIYTFVKEVEFSVN